jgi:hypothetical protein
MLGYWKQIMPQGLAGSIRLRMLSAQDMRELLHPSVRGFTKGPWNTVETLQTADHCITARYLFQKQWILAASIQVGPRQRGGPRCLGAAEHCCIDTLDALEELLSVDCLHSIAHVRVTKLKNVRAQFRSRKRSSGSQHLVHRQRGHSASAHEAGRLQV